MRFEASLALATASFKAVATPYSRIGDRGISNRQEREGSGAGESRCKHAEWGPKTVVAEVASQPYRFRGSIQQFSQFIGFLQSLMVLCRGEGEVGY